MHQQTKRRRRFLVATLAGTLVVGASGPYTPRPARAAAAPAAPADFQPNQKVEAREGDTWSVATVVKKEGRKFQIKYEDGTEEWVTADRLRVAGTGPAGGAVPAGGAAAGGAATKPGAGGVAAKPAPKEQYAIGAQVEVKEASSWSPAKIKNRDGDLYLVIFDRWESQMFWQWVHVSMVRNKGDSKAGPKWADGVRVSGRSVQQAKAEAQTKFANRDKEMAAEKAEAEAEARGQKADPFAPKPYDKPITPVVMTGAKELVAGGAPGKPPAPEPVDPAIARLNGRPIVLKGQGDRATANPDLVFAGTYGLVIYTNSFGADVKSVLAERVNLTTGISDGPVIWDNLSVPQTISPSGQRVLGRAPGFFGGTRNRVDLWDLPLSAGGAPPTPKHLISFLPYEGRDKNERDVDLTILVDDDHALTCSNKGELIYWKVGPGAAAALWRMTVNGATQVALTPGGKRLAAMTSSGLAVIDIATGDTLSVAEGGRAVSSLVVSPDGKRAAGVSGTLLGTWDLEKGTFGGDIGLPAGVIARSVAFANDGFVLLSGTYLVDTARKMVVWKYEGATGPVAGYAGRVWTTVADGQRKVLTSADLPQDKVRKAAAALGPVLDPGSMLLRPGAVVSLEVSIEGPDEQRKAAVDAITAQLKQNGVTIADGQPVKVVARTENGKTTEKLWESRNGFGPPFGGPRLGGPFGGEVEKASVTEKITRVYVETNGKVAWENRTVSTPSFVTRKQGQSVAEAVGAANTFNLAFLQSVRVPTYVPRPADPPEQGKSTWVAAGVRE